METIRISDISMKQIGKKNDLSLTFKGKLEVSKLLDKLGVSVIEVEGISRGKADELRVKSISSAVKNSTLAVPVELTAESVARTWEALREAADPRLQVFVPVSTVQMEYICHMKPEAVLAAIRSTVAECAARTSNVEFLAEDATRSDPAFLKEAVEAAVAAGATTVTLCDAAGKMLPDEFEAFLRKTQEEIPALRSVTLGVACANTLALADAAAVAAVRAGAREIKTAVVPGDVASLPNVTSILAAREDALGVSSGIHTVELKRIASQITWICSARRSKSSPFDNGVQDAAPDLTISAGDDASFVLRAAKEIGYDLSPEDAEAVWQAAQNVLAHRERVGARELDAIIASVAMQVPAAYKVESYVINIGDHISAMAHLKLSKNGEVSEGMALGDGPVDAAFLAIEQIIRRHYELDDFQIRSVTEGKEAMGEAVVRLVSNGRLYSGRGISTDIVGSSIQAYVNALNKIAYEEEGE